MCQVQDLHTPLHSFLGFIQEPSALQLVSASCNCVIDTDSHHNWFPSLKWQPCSFRADGLDAWNSACPMTRKLRKGGRFLLHAPFCLDWDGSSAMGNCVKHIALHLCLVHFWGRAISGHRNHHGTGMREWDRAIGASSAGLPLSLRGQDPDSYGNYMCMSGENVHTVVWEIRVNAEREIKWHLCCCFQSHRA